MPDKVRHYDRQETGCTKRKTVVHAKGARVRLDLAVKKRLSNRSISRQGLGATSSIQAASEKRNDPAFVSKLAKRRCALWHL